MASKKVTSSIVGIILPEEQTPTCNARITWTLERGTGKSKETILHAYAVKSARIAPTNKWKIQGTGYLIENAYPEADTPPRSVKITNRLPSAEEADQSLTNLSSLETI